MSTTIKSQDDRLIITKFGVENSYYKRDLIISFVEHQPIQPSQLLEPDNNGEPILEDFITNGYPDIETEITSGYNSVLIIKHRDNILPNPVKEVFKLDYVDHDNIMLLDSQELFGEKYIRNIYTILNGLINSSFVNTSTSSAAEVDLDLSETRFLDIMIRVNNQIFNLNNPSVGNYTLIIRQGSSGGNAFTFSNTIKHPASGVPAYTTDPNAMDIIDLYYDGTDFYLKSFNLNFA